MTIKKYSTFTFWFFSILNYANLKSQLWIVQLFRFFLHFHFNDLTDWKPVSSIRVGVKEIRVKDEQEIFRVIYVVKYLDRVIVLHAFQKKTEKTAKKDLDLAKERARNNFDN